MLDENLPTFFLKQSPNGSSQNQSFYLTHRGSDPEPAYNLKKPDPASPTGKNCYAAALFDSYNTEVLYGEVLIQPEWTLPTLSQEEIRRNGGVPPPPQPILPQEFTIQLYNPDQQVVVRQKAGSWGAAPTYNFSMPQQTFRLPSASTLDRQHSDPAADGTTLQINFSWKREGKISKDLACYMTGRSNDVVKKKNREPDIIVSMFQALREVTIYESNYHRIDIEDPKGLEVVLLLGAAVLKDVYFGSLKEAFNLANPGSNALRKHSSSLTLLNPGRQKPTTTSTTPPIPTTVFPQHTQLPPQSQVPGRTPGQPGAAASHRPPPAPQPASQKYPYATPPSPYLPPRPASANNQRPPAVDPRSQWEIDAQTAQLKAQQDAERARLDASRREQERADAAEAKRLKKQMEAQEKEQRRKQAEIDKETERLRRKYGTQSQAFTQPALPIRQNVPPAHQQQQHYPVQAPPPPQPQQQYPHPNRPQYLAPQYLPPRPQPLGWHAGPYMGSSPQGPPTTMAGGSGYARPGPYGHMPSASTSSFFGGGGRPPPPAMPQQQQGFTSGVGSGVKPKKSFWGLGSSSSRGDAGGDRSVARRKSTMLF